MCYNLFTARWFGDKTITGKCLIKSQGICITSPYLQGVFHWMILELSTLWNWTTWKILRYRGVRNEMPNSCHLCDSSAQGIQSGWGSCLLWWHPNADTATEIAYKHINRLGTKVALSTLIQTILIFMQVLASIISCCMIYQSLVHLFFCWLQKGPPGLRYLVHAIRSKNASCSKREKICGTWELKQN